MALFSRFSVVREGRVKFLVLDSSLHKDKNLTSENAFFPFAKNRAPYIKTSFFLKRSWHCCLKLLLLRSEGVVLPLQHHGIRPQEKIQTGFTHRRASYRMDM